jgi:hypothetical protein
MGDKNISILIDNLNILLNMDNVSPSEMAKFLHYGRSIAKERGVSFFIEFI